MNPADKANIFSIISCFLMSYGWDIPFFYNIAIGISIGSAFWYYLQIYRGMVE